ncbi:DNA polymerase sliding clamp [Synechococcus phage S-SCSM1]|uniref:Sliding clamp n=1 Tax=Synechococcus phage S-SCSM1 TaxID=2588487 RepID=A0A6M2ZHV7_9CAUD|nr:DNA polymerase sliding clamp [Synechococcus phage S-SCSM1]QFG06317.1 DNA polymerase sliding clamp [Synechococcus phage S-SCSM1]
MKLSDSTVNILKNFSNINQSLLFKEGKKLRTISVMKNILAEVEVTEEFPKDFGIYDLNQFLNGLSLHQSPELDIENDSYMVIREGKMRSKYFFADPNVIISPPEKDIVLTSEEISFDLNTQQLDKLLKASAVYQLPDLSVVGENGVVKLVVSDRKNDTSNDFSIIVGETEHKFSFNFKVENIKILPGSYQVSISKKLLSKFVNSDKNLTYWIALEPDSSYED